MAGIITDNGEKYALDRVLSAGLTLRLFKNNYTPVAASVLGDFTECDFTGYTAKTVAAWPASTTVSNKASSTHAAQTWTNTGSSQTVYGYYLTNSSNVVVAAELFGASVTLATNQPLAVTPTMTTASE